MCFSLHRHEAPVTKLKLYCDHKHQSSLVPLHWENEVTLEHLEAWKDLKALVENAAICVVVLIAKARTGYQVVQRSAGLNAIDYYLGNDFFDFSAQLETSGIFRDTSSELEKRFIQKVNRLSKYSSNVPTYVGVVEFSNLESKFCKVQ